MAFQNLRYKSLPQWVRTQLRVLPSGRDLSFPGKKHLPSLVFSEEQNIQDFNLIYLNIPHLSPQPFESTKDPKPWSDLTSEEFLLQILFTYCFSTAKKKHNKNKTTNKQEECGMCLRVMLQIKYFGKREMRDVTAIFVTSRFKIKRGLMPVAVSWTAVQFRYDSGSDGHCHLSVVWLALHVHLSLGGERLPLWHFQIALRDPEEKGPHITECCVTSVHNLGYSHTRPHDLIFLEERSSYRQILCWGLPATECHTFTPSVAANAVLTACRFESCQHFHKREKYWTSRMVLKAPQQDSLPALLSGHISVKLPPSYGSMPNFLCLL